MSKKTLLFALGFALIVIGVALTLRDWLFMVMVFRGMIGPLLAVTGLVLMASLKD